MTDDALDALRDEMDPDETPRCVDCGVEVDGLGPPICRECATTPVAVVSSDEGLRARLQEVMHRHQCDEQPAHPSTDHLPWDEPDDEQAWNALADDIIATVLATDTPPQEGLDRW